MVVILLTAIISFICGVIFNEGVLFMANDAVTKAQNFLSRGESYFDRSKELMAEAEKVRAEANKLNASTAEMLSRMAVDNVAITIEIDKIKTTINQMQVEA